MPSLPATGIEGLDPGLSSGVGNGSPLLQVSASSSEHPPVVASAAGGRPCRAPLRPLPLSMSDQELPRLFPPLLPDHDLPDLLVINPFRIPTEFGSLREALRRISNCRRHFHRTLSHPLPLLLLPHLSSILSGGRRLGLSAMKFQMRMTIPSIPTSPRPRDEWTLPASSFVTTRIFPVLW